MPRTPPPPPPPNGPGRHRRPSDRLRGEERWFVNFEREVPLAEAMRRFQEIIGPLSADGKVVFKSRDEQHSAEPSDPCAVLIRYESTPHRSRVIRMEIEWADGVESTNELDGSDTDYSVG